MLIFEGTFSGAWLAFIGWFLLQAATAEARYIATEQALEDFAYATSWSKSPSP